MKRCQRISLFVCFGILYLLFSIEGQGQEITVSETWKEYLEIFAEQNESEDAYIDLLETLEFYHENPINLNDTVADDLLHLFFLSDFLIHSIKAYIAQNGSMLSIYELQYINGFTQELISLILPFVCVKPVETRKSFINLKDFRYGKHTFQTGYRQVLEKQKGFSTPDASNPSASRYLGSNFGTYFRYRYNVRNKILFGLAGEKDAGEELFGGLQPNGFDHYSFYLALNDLAVIKRFVIGDYHLQFGQGLTLWTGFGYTMPANGLLKKFPQNVKPSASLSEYGVMRGAASSIKLKDFLVTAFYSNAYRDASVTEVDETGEVTTVSSIQTSGYHRTLTELKNKNALHETLFGANVQFKKQTFNLGTTVYKQLFSANIEPTPHPYNIFYFSGNENLNAGIDGAYRWKNFSFFGEVAMSQNGGKAGLIGTELSLRNNSSLGVVYRNYSQKYQNMYALPIAQNSQVNNERGFLLAFQSMLPWHVRMILIADVFNFPWLKYQVNAPSAGEEFRINLLKQLNRQTGLTFVYRFKNKPSNTKDESAFIPYVEQFHKQIFQANLSYRSNNVWSFNTRIEYNFYNAEKGQTNSGFLLCQDVNFSPTRIPLSFSFRYALFNAETYENRMYIYERNLLYEYSLPAYSNNGSRLYGLVNWNINKHFRVGARYAIWYYPWEETIGSGLSEIQGNKKQEIGLQLQLKL